MKKLICVPYIDQTKDYPTGCESISAVMLLAYLGISVSPDEFIEYYLEQEPMQKKTESSMDRIRVPDLREALMTESRSAVMRR